MIKNIKLVIATGSGVVIAAPTKNSWNVIHSALQDRRLKAIAAGSHSIIAGSRTGLVRSLDEGRSWQRVQVSAEDTHIRALSIFQEDPTWMFVGSEPAEIFVSHDGGANWENRPEVTTLREKYRWHLPYSPEAGCVRDFAFVDERGYAAVEVGGLLRSDDSGRTWQLMDREENPDLADAPDPWIHPDVHSVTIHPLSPNLIFAPTGGGLFVSGKGGRSWTRLHSAYCRAVWVHPGDPRFIILGTADGPDENGRIERSTDGGQTWEVDTHHTDPAWQRTMVEQFLRIGDQLLANLSNGIILTTKLGFSGKTEWHAARDLPDNARSMAASAAEPERNEG